jgi:hypothetical protein
MRTDHDCSCGDCTTADLPVTPFEALRARHGMLLGEDDFRVVLGNPRGKQMLHTSWLHGTGVVWGYDVCRSGQVELVVRPGLAVDGLGRELALDSTVTLDVRRWVAREDERCGTAPAGDECRSRTVRACLVADFDCDAARPVPTLADPCDVTRTHDTASRILEGVRVGLVAGRCRPCPPRHGERAAYHRLRVLLGLDRARPRDDAGEWAERARDDVACRPEHERVAALLHHARCLAAADAAELGPACQEGTDVPTRFLVPEAEAAVVLACVEIDLRDADGCTTVEEVRPDPCCRCVLLPTQVLGELLVGLAAGLIDRADGEGHQGGAHGGDEGPRVYADEVTWDDDDRCYRLPVSDELVAGSVRRAVTVTSLSDRGWVEEDVESVRYDAAGRRIVVHLGARPDNDVVRLVVKGTGPTPVYGVAPAAPLAGIWGGPRAGRHDGHDAVITVTGRRGKYGRSEDGRGKDEES